MRYEVNECCGCATPSYPCRGDACSLRHVTKYRCDKCGADELNEDEVVHDLGYEDICLYCAEEIEEES